MLEAPDNLTATEVLTTAQAARHAGVRPSAITNWRERGYIGTDGEREHLRNLNVDAAGKPLGPPKYAVADVARAEYATRRHAIPRANPFIAALQVRDRRAAAA
ncbi:hypothetical protein [Embleya sp. NPDC001921]